VTAYHKMALAEHAAEIFDQTGSGRAGSPWSPARTGTATSTWATSWWSPHRPT